MKQQLIIYGAGGLGREVLSMLNHSEEWEVEGFIDDGRQPGELVGGVEVLGGVTILESYSGIANLVIALGQPQMKVQVVKRLERFNNIHYPTLIHPSAVIQSDTVRIGKGCIIGAGTIVTTEVSIGSHVLINLNTTVGHDCVIKDFVSVMPGVNIAGGVTIGEQVLIGSGVNIMNKIAIHDRSIVGMGSLVLKDVSADTTVVGVPAKPINL